MEFKEDMKVLRKGGDNLVSKKPFFSWDSKYLLLICDEVVKVYSLAGSGCVQVLRCQGGNITNILQHPHNRVQVLLTDSNGVLSCWSYEGGVMLWSVSCSCALVCACVSGGRGGEEKKEEEEEEDDSLMIHGVVDNGDKGFKLVKIVIAPNNTGDNNNDDNNGHNDDDGVMMMKSCKSLLDGIKSTRSLFHFGNNNSMLAHDEGVSSIKVINLLDQHTYKHRLANRLKITCLSSSPTSPAVAVGTHTGAILLHPHATSHTHTITTLHWHSLPLTTLSYTPDGSSLLSGGEECVLIRWSLSNNNKHPFPRLPAPIIHISTDPQSSLYALSLRHNGIELISNTWKAAGNIQGMSIADDDVKKGVDDDVTEGRDDEMMLVDHRASLLMLRGFHGRIQMYDVINDQHVYSVDVTQENYISPENLSQPVSSSKIDHVSLSKDADWLLTGQSVTYEDGGGVGEVYLKFWRRSQDGNHTIKTIAKDPHRGRSTSSISNQSPLTSQPYFVTMATNRHAPFIVWNISLEGDWQGTHILTHHNMTPSHLLSNHNGSALALIFQQTCVTFWDAVTCDMTYKSNFPQPIRHATFSRDLDCMYVTSSDLLIHWSPVLKEQWQRSSKVTCMCVTPHNNLVTFDLSATVEIYEKTSNQPIRSYHLNSPHPIINACFLNNQLYFMNSRKIIYTLVQSDYQESKKSTTTSINTILPPPPSSPTKHHHHHHHHHELPFNYEENDRFLQYLLDTPSHMLPPTNTWALSYLHTLL